MTISASSRLTLNWIVPIGDLPTCFRSSGNSIPCEIELRIKCSIAVVICCNKCRSSSHSSPSTSRLTCLPNSAPVCRAKRRKRGVNTLTATKRVSNKSCCTCRIIRISFCSNCSLLSNCWDKSASKFTKSFKLSANEREIL